MSYIEMLDDYITKNFIGLKLKSPLFYNAPIAIRFELGGTLAEQVKKRLKTLYKTLNRNTDDIYITIFVDSWGENPISSFEDDVLNIFRKYVSNITTNHIDKIEREYRYKDPDDSDDTVTFQFCVKAKAAEVDTNGLLEAMANRYLGFSSSFIGDLFFVNETNNTIFHCYDSRGADVVAKEKETLRNLYEEYNGWILGHDKNVIDKIFNH